MMTFVPTGRWAGNKIKENPPFSPPILGESACMNNKKIRKSPCPSQVFKARSCSEGCAGTCSLSGFYTAIMLPDESLCTQMLKVEFNHCRLFHILPMCYDSNKTWTLLCQSTVAGLCCDSKWLLNAVQQDSLAFCHTQHIVGTYLHIPNSFIYDTWTNDPFFPTPIHESNTDVSIKFCSLPTLPGINTHSQTQSSPPSHWLSLYLLMKHEEENRNFWKFHIGNDKIKPR